MGLHRWLAKKIIHWLTRERSPGITPLCDFDHLCNEIRPADVVLIEGRSRVSDVIKTVTLSPWTHAALYVGRIRDVDDAVARERLRLHYNGSSDDRVIVEAELGRGTVVSPLSRYARDHIRICRPSRLSRRDAQAIVRYAAEHLGIRYDVRHLLDLARFLLPYAILPRRWRSSVFEYHAGVPTRTVCSSMIAAAFNAVSFPIRPVIQRSGDGEVRLYKRNPRVFTPKDFDYSPYFDVIKCPFPGFDDLAIYRQLPWGHDSIVCHEDGDRRLSPPLGLRTAPRSDAESIHARSADRHPLDDAPGDRRATGGATES